MNDAGRRCRLQGCSSEKGRETAAKGRGRCVGYRVTVAAWRKFGGNEHREWLHHRSSESLASLTLNVVVVVAIAAAIAAATSMAAGGTVREVRPWLTMAGPSVGCCYCCGYFDRWQSSPC